MYCSETPIFSYLRDFDFIFLQTIIQYNLLNCFEMIPRNYWVDWKKNEHVSNDKLFSWTNFRPGSHSQSIIFFVIDHFVWGIVVKVQYFHIFVTLISYFYKNLFNITFSTILRLFQETFEWIEKRMNTFRTTNHFFGKIFGLCLIVKISSFSLLISLYEVT